MNAHNNPRVLVVDIDAGTRSRIELLLKDRFGAEVELADTLRQAREMLAACAFDVITLGYSFPDGTGLDLLREITSKDAHPFVIIVTGQGNEEIASWSVRDGALGYVLKDDEIDVRLSQAFLRALEQSELQRTRQGLEESEAFYRSLFDNSPDALFIETVDGQIEEANLAACSLLGYEPEELKGMHASELVPQARREDLEGAEAVLLAGEQVEFENRRKDGTTVPVTVSAREVITRRGPRYLIRVRDMSEVVKAESIVEKERAFTMRTLDALPEIFVLIDTDGHYVRWNSALNEVTGYTDDEIAGLSHADFHPREDVPRIEATIAQIVATGKAQLAETRILTKDGRAIPYELSGALLRDEDGMPVAVAGLGRDISERRRAEEALRNMVRETNARREEITALLESTRIVLEHDTFEETASDIFKLCKKLVGASVGYVALFGGAASELVIVEPESLREGFQTEGHMRASALHGTDFTLGRPMIDNAFAASELSERIPEGHISIQNMMIAPLIAAGETAGLMCLANKPGGFDKRDSLMASAFSEIVSISLQNSRNLKMLKESEERFRSVAETANEAIICSDSLGNITFWNPGAQAMFGYSTDEAVGQALTMILPERMRQERLQSFVRLASRGEGGPGRTYELVGLRKDSTEFFMELSRSAPWIVSDDVCITAIIRDITGRKAAEMALARSEAEYRAIVEDQTELITRYLPSGKVTFVNEANARFFGKTRAEMMELESFLPLIPPEEHDYILAEIQKISREHPVVNIEHSAFDGEGDTRWLHWTNHGIFDSEGELVEYQAVGRDITDRKAVEDALKESENRYRLLFDTAPDGIYSIGNDGVIHALNSAFEKWTGFKRDEWLGKPFAPIIHPDDLALAVETFQQALEGGRPAPYELRILCGDGSYMTAEFISAPLMKGDEIVGEFGIARDVTERNDALKALAESEELYRGLLATSPDSVVVTDLDYKVTMVSDRAVEQQRASGPEQLVGMSALDSLLPDGALKAELSAGDIVEKGLSEPTEFTILRRDGTTFLGEITASLLRDPEGNPKAFISTIRDVTARKKAEHELQVLNNELEGYAHAVSHDLKGPLASIGAASATIQGLLKGDLTDEVLEGVDEMVGVIGENVQKSTALIDDLLELAEAGQKPIDANEVDVGVVVRDVLSERRDVIKAKRVKVKADSDLGSVVASRTHMYQLFSNLIDNAIKHNDARKPIIAIEYHGYDEAGAHCYSVKDNGPGIPPEDQEKVFLPFVSGVRGETGLGLTTVAKIVGLYQGTVIVRNDGGACFDFALRDYP